MIPAIELTDEAVEAGAKALDALVTAEATVAPEDESSIADEARTVLNAALPYLRVKP